METDRDSLERVLDARGVDEVWSQSAAVERKERVQNDSGGAGRRDLEPE